VGARLAGDGAVRISGVAGIREAGEGQITFLANPRYEEHVARTRASAIILHDDMAPVPIPSLRSPAPYVTFLEVLKLFSDAGAEQPEMGIHPTAVIEEGVDLGPFHRIGPFVVIGRGTRIGQRAVILAGCYIGPGCVIGEDCVFQPRVVVHHGTVVGDRVLVHAGAVLGADGFGQAPDGERYRKIPQIGHVLIEDDVEIGANSTIDRATIGVTRIGRGSRLDNLVMIAHNVEVGENTIICAQVGISGSTRVGRHVTLAGQAGVVGHIEIGDGARVGAQGGVTKSIPAGESYSGYPAQPHVRATRGYAALRQLPEALRRLHRAESRLRELEERLGGGGTTAGGHGTNDRKELETE